MNKTKELKCNIKCMTFLNPKIKKKFYDKITSTFGDDYEKFFQVFGKKLY